MGRNLVPKDDVRTCFSRSPAPTVDCCDAASVTIDVIPDVALLRIFDFYLGDEWASIDTWHTLVHVCQKWRNVVFESPRRLDLQLHFNSTTEIEDTDDIWPPLPISIRVFNHRIRFISRIRSTLLHNDRIHELTLWRVPSEQLDKIVEKMQTPYPALTSLTLEPGDEEASSVPASFLGGSAPRLRELNFYHIRFPGLLNLLLSATHLVTLELVRIPHLAYITPKAMITCLSVLTKLESLILGFESPQTRRDRRRRPPTHTLLPVLTKFQFRGLDKYLEVLVAWIDAPLLDELDIKFFLQPAFDTPQLAQFIRRTPKFKAHDEETMVFSYKDVSVTLPRTFDGKFELRILNEYHH